CSNQVKVRNEIVNGLPSLCAQSLNKLKAYPATTKLIVGIVTIFPLRIEHCNSIGQPVARAVVVTYYKINTFLPGISYMINGFNTTVKCNNQGTVIIVSIIYTCKRNAIAFVIPVGYIGVDIRIERAQVRRYQSHRC